METVSAGDWILLCKVLHSKRLNMTCRSTFDHNRLRTGITLQWTDMLLRLNKQLALHSYIHSSEENKQFDLIWEKLMRTLPGFIQKTQSMSQTLANNHSYIAHKSVFHIGKTYLILTVGTCVIKQHWRLYIKFCNIFL